MVVITNVQLVMLNVLNVLVQVIRNVVNVLKLTYWLEQLAILDVLLENI